ncbi:MAG: Lrp/AsnC family transcriptional regulator [Methanomicrobiales archaeon]|nr:Lrp/AsnC family transcriptional regulator [Methanomicrobiales archaeon]
MKSEYIPDQTDMQILDSLQDSFPLTSHPYQVLAERVTISEEEFISRLSRLHDMGIIRSISPVLESKHLGMHAATLVAMHVSKEKIHAVAEIVNGFPEVTHNFIRDHYYSLWFTLIGKDHDRIDELISEILKQTNIPECDILNLISVKKYKADVRFPL